MTIVGGSTGQSSARLALRIEVRSLLFADRLRRLTLIALEVVDDAPADVCGQRGALPVESAVPVERRARAVIDGIELGTEELVADAGFEFRTVALKVLFGQLTPVGATTGGQSEGQQDAGDREQNGFRMTHHYSLSKLSIDKLEAGLPTTSVHISKMVLPAVYDEFADATGR
jgi:hypothetical protein